METALKISGRGNAGVRGGRVGDLYVVVNVKQHEFYKRDSSDLYCTIPVPFTTLVLGGAVQYPWVDGSSQTLAVKAGTQSGERIIVRGKGVVSLRSGSPGDLFCELRAQIPIKLSKKATAQVKDLAAVLEGEEYHDPSTKKWYDTIKRIFGS